MEKRYESCTLTDLAQLAGMELNTFQALLMREDLQTMLQLGWNPFARKLPPSVVRFLRTKFIEGTLSQNE